MGLKSMTIRDSRKKTCDISQTDWAALISDGSVDKRFSSFYNKLNKLVNKHAPLKTVSKRKAKKLSKPWITRDLRKSIKIKNDHFYSGDTATYKLYRNEILSLSRQSKRLYYHFYFSSNLNNMKKTWEGINTLIISTERLSSYRRSSFHTTRVQHKPIRNSYCFEPSFHICWT